MSEFPPRESVSTLISSLLNGSTYKSEKVSKKCLVSKHPTCHAMLALGLRGGAWRWHEAALHGKPYEKCVHIYVRSFQRTTMALFSIQVKRGQ